MDTSKSLFSYTALTISTFSRGAWKSTYRVIW